jgi:hypothetical protein
MEPTQRDELCALSGNRLALMPLESLRRFNELKDVALDFHQCRLHLERRYGKEFSMGVYEVNATACGASVTSRRARRRVLRLGLADLLLFPGLRTPLAPQPLVRLSVVPSLAGAKAR